MVLNKTIYLLDSNVWVAFFDVDEENHFRALEIFAEVDSDPYSKIVLPEIVFIEVINVLFKKTHNINELVGVIKSILDFGKIEFRYVNKVFWKNFVIKNIIHIELKTLDLIIACYAKYYKVNKFYTFDKKLESQIFKL